MKTVQIAGFVEPNKYLGTDSSGNLVLKDGGGGGGGTNTVTLQGYMTSAATSYPNYPAVTGQIGAGSGPLGEVKKGNSWWVKEANTIIDGKKVVIGTLLIALIDSPSVAADWLLQEDITANFELLANKSNDFVGDQGSTVKYPNVKTVWDYIQSVISSITSALGLKENLSNKSTDGTLSSNSDTLYPSQRAAKTYIDDLGNTLTTGLATKLTKTANLSDVTNPAVARDNLGLGTTSDASFASVTVANVTANSLAFIDGTKKIVTALGTTFGTWLNGLSAKSTPIGADVITTLDSENGFEAKKTTLTELWTNYLRALVFATSLTTNRILKWDGSKLVDGLFIDDGTGVSIGTRGTNSLFDLGNNTVDVGALPTLHSRPYPRSTSSVQPSGTSVSVPHGSIVYWNNGTNGDGLYVYRRYGAGEGWRQLLDTGSVFTNINQSNPDIGTGIATMSASNSTLPTLTASGNNQIGYISVGGSRGIRLFVNGGGSQLLKPFEGESWYVLGYTLRDWDNQIIATTANGGRGAGCSFSTTKSSTSTTLHVVGTTDTNSPYYSIEYIVKIDSNGNPTSLIITKPSSDPSAYTVGITGGRIVYSGTIPSNGFSTGYSWVRSVNYGLFGNLYTNYQENERYSADATVKYWAGSGGFALGTSTINASAQLELQATNKGFLPNRVTTTQRLAISSPAQGLTVYDTTLNQLCTFNGGINIEANWKKYTAGVPITYQFAPLQANIATVVFNKVVATGSQASTNGSGYATYPNIDPYLVEETSIITEVGIRLTQASVSQGTVGASPTVRIDVYRNLVASRTLIGTYRIVINPAGVGVSSTLSTLTNANTYYSLTGLTDVLTKGESIGAEFVTENADNNKINAVTNCQLIIKTLA